MAASPATEPETRVPDRTDRQWPRHPPWDACPRPVWEGERATGQPGAGRRVLVIGDSLTRDSRILSARGMRAAGWTPTFRCWGSRRLDWGLAQVARARALRQLPGYVILALGTNDISWETPATTERRVRTLLDRLGPDRNVLWVDLHLTRSAWLDARADWFNALLRRLERSHPNLTVVRWHAVARAHRIHGWDGIHYGPGGFRLRAQAVVRPSTGSAVPILSFRRRRCPLRRPRRSRIRSQIRSQIRSRSGPHAVARALIGRSGRDAPGNGPCQGLVVVLRCYP